MMVREVTKAELEKGITCPACWGAIPASTLYRVTCPHCGLTVQARAEDPRPGRVQA